ncbi:MAG: 3-phosphoglycerate dehydrogenase [Phycisphaerae bacterium]|nr:3-phosphoglycerate dehydrogenase [Phycisphaerae bacterium]
MPLVIQTEQLDPAAAAWLGERVELVRCGSDEPGFAPLLSRAEGLLIRTYTRVDRAMLDAGPRLRVVARAGVGLDNVDLDACRARGIAVLNTPDANTQAVVEFVLALVLDDLRPRESLDGPLPLRPWNDLRDRLVAPRQLSDLTLGILGLGRIGSRVARAAHALGVRVVYHDLLDLPEPHRHHAHPVPLTQLFVESDVLTIHIDGRPENRLFVNAALLGRLKPDALLVNTARGFVLDAAALAAFLRSHPAARAALDVHEPEPFDAAYPLLGLPNARLTPHLASATATAKRNMSWVVRDLCRALTGVG